MSNGVTSIPPAVDKIDPNLGMQVKIIQKENSENSAIVSVLEEPSMEKSISFTDETIGRLSKKYPCNVITENVFQKRIQELFSLVAYTVGKTAGPYGAATMIEEMGAHHMTKDGFTVLKNIRFNNRMDNTIHNLVLTISHQMVMKVGDGSTTAILAAHKFLDIIHTDPRLKKIRPKDIQEFIKEYVDMVCDRIQRNATQISDEDYVEIMERIARVSTNDNDEYTQFIKEIYEKSGRDTSISKRMSPTNKAKYEIKDDMFYIAGGYIDKIYCNAEGGSKCNLPHPNVLLFNFTLGDEHWNLVQGALRYMLREKPGERMLIVAPNYDQYFMDKVRADTHDYITAVQQESSGGGALAFPMVFAKNPYFKPVEREIFEDLAPMLGTRVFSVFDSEEILRKIDTLRKTVSAYNQAVAADKNAQEAWEEMVNRQRGLTPDTQRFMAWLQENPRPVIEIPEDDGSELREEIEEYMGKFFGSSEAVSIGADTIEFHGFPRCNQQVLDVHILDAKDKFNKEQAELENQRYITKDYIDAQERLARIARKSALIYVGGNNDLEKKFNDDALDDAIRACRSAIQYGYNLGNNLAIFKANAEIHDEVDSSTDISADKKEVFKLIATALDSSFLAVINMIHRNKDESITIDQTADIIDASLESESCYDLNTDAYNKEIINSCRTDIEVLRGAISIVGTILSANQYIASDIQTGEENK